MGVVLGVLAAVFLGASDFNAARASRVIPSITVTRTALAVSTLATPILLLIAPFTVRGRDLALAGGSGILICLGLYLLYKAYGIAPIGIVAPTTSVLIALVPVLVDAVTGHRPGPLGVVGVVLGLTGLALVTFQRGGAGSVTTGIVIGTIAGSIFGAAFVLMARTSDGSGLLPVAVQRGSGLVTLLLVRLWHPAPTFAAKGPTRLPAVMCGVYAVVAIACLQIGYRNGDAGPVSVAVSQFATAAVVLSVVFDHERLRRAQVLGIALAAVGVGFLATA